MNFSDTIDLHQEGEIALISIDNPPVNAAGLSVREGLAKAMAWLATHPEIRSAALYAKGRTFVAGADIREFGKPPVEPYLPDVCQMIEDCPVPIACILHGTTLGGGLEIAMSCHARLGFAGAKMGLPEVLLGIMPGAGGTQRMPRLTGQGFAVEAITTGRHVPLDEAIEAGLVDGMADGETPEDAARNAALALLEHRLNHRKTGALKVQPDAEAIAAAKARITAKQPHLFSPLKCVEAVEFSTQPVLDGIRQERVLYLECQASPQRAGLINAFFAERAVAKVPEASATPYDLNAIGVIGAGTMGAGIATAGLLAGLDVTLTDRTQEALDRGLATITKNLEGAVKRGKLKTVETALDHLSSATALDSLSSADLIIEAAFEDLDVKRSIFGDLDRIAKPGAVLATNTSYLDVNDIAAATKRPEAVLGLHFFSPAHVMKLLEIVVTKDTSPEAAATGFALGKKLRKIAVRSGVCDGFIGNRILRNTRKAVEYMMLDGAPFEQIDNALQAAGWALGPFRTGDMSGLDIAWAARKRLAATRPAKERYVSTPDMLCEAGHYGRKTGAGYYLNDGSPNPAARDAVEKERSVKSITARTFSDQEIVDRFLTAMIIEATDIVAEGIALRPIDVDAVKLFGYGFPRHLGGPLCQADQIGLPALIKRIETYAGEDAYFWRVPSLLKDLAESGRSFADLNSA